MTGLSFLSSQRGDRLTKVLWFHVPHSNAPPWVCVSILRTHWWPPISRSARFSLIIMPLLIRKHIVIVAAVCPNARRNSPLPPLANTRNSVHSPLGRGRLKAETIATNQEDKDRYLTAQRSVRHPHIYMTGASRHSPRRCSATLAQPPLASVSIYISLDRTNVSLSFAHPVLLFPD